MKHQVTKTEAARSQIDTAIKLYMHDDDFVSIHTLIHAAVSILHNLCEHKNKAGFSMKARLIARIKEDHVKEVIAKINEAGNFFKHADKDPSDILDFDPRKNELWLFDACIMYIALTGDQTDLMHAYLTWFGIQNPNYIKDEYAQEKFADADTFVNSKKEFLDIFIQAKHSQN